MNFFICHVPFQYYTFKSIYTYLEDAYFVIPPFEDKIMTPEYGGGMSKEGLYEYVKDFLRRKKVEVVHYGERTGEGLAKFLNENAKNVIASHWFDGIYLLNNVRVVRLIYGLANKSSSTYSIFNNFLMDLILTYGPSSADRFKEQGLMAQPIGNPIYDSWFNNNINEDEIKIVERRLDDKPTILYLPTFSGFSSIEKFYNSLVSLSGDYNIIVKLHHGTFNGEANRLCKLLSYSELIVLGDYIDPQILYKLADIVLVENSGAVYDAILLGKPVIMLGSSLGNNGYDIFDEREKTYEVEKSDIIPSTDQPRELKALIANNINKKPTLDKNMRYSLFFHNDGKAGKRAAEIIMNDKEYPFIPSLDKYNKGIKLISDPAERHFIEKRKKEFLRDYYPEQTKKPGFFARAYRHFFV